MRPRCGRDRRCPPPTPRAPSTAQPASFGTFFRRITGHSPFAGADVAGKPPAANGADGASDKVARMLACAAIVQAEAALHDPRAITFARMEAEAAAMAAAADASANFVGIGDKHAEAVARATAAAAAAAAVMSRAACSEMAVRCEGVDAKSMAAVMQAASAMSRAASLEAVVEKEAVAALEDAQEEAAVAMAAADKLRAQMDMKVARLQESVAVANAEQVHRIKRRTAS